MTVVAAPAVFWRDTLERLWRPVDELLRLEGVVCAALVEARTGKTLDAVGGGGPEDRSDAEHVRAKLRVMHELGVDDAIDDLLVALGGRYHILRRCPQLVGVFLHLVLDRTQGDLGMARRQAKALGAALGASRPALR
jgi:hypothetical protein